MTSTAMTTLETGRPSVTSRFTGTLALTRHALRRDRVLASVWIAVMVLLVYASAAATPTIYSSEAERVQAAQAVSSSPATVALYGPILDVYSEGELAMLKMTVLYALFAGLLFVVIVRRHTRVDEERGLAELVGSAPVGRDAFYAATLVESVLLSTVLAAGAALVSIAGGLPVAGSILFALSWFGTFLVATAITAVAVQVAASARTCGAIAIGTLIALFVIRAAGDTAWPALSWLSPLGWNTQLRAWSDPRPWVQVLYLLTAAALTVLAATLRSRRDLGSGLLADRPGKIHGSPWLASALALAWRVNRASVIVWTVAIAVMGTLLGAIVPVAARLLEGNTASEIIRRMGGPGAIEDSLLTAEMGIVALGITCFAISVATRAAEDERSGRAEQVRATAVSRTAVWVASSIVAFVGSAWLALLAGVAAAIGAGRSIPEVAAASLVQVPAVWVTTAITLFALAFGSRFAVFGWAVLGAFVISGFVGETLGLPDWITGISPYQHVPQLPAGTFDWLPEFGLLAVAAAVTLAGWLTFRARDIG